MDGYHAVDPSLEAVDDWHPEGSVEPGQKVRRKRNRKPVSCAQCRKRKLKCDRQEPCKACVERGEGPVCDWSEAKRASPKPSERSSYAPRPSTSYAQAGTSKDVADLRSQVDRLEFLLDHFQASANGKLRPPSPPMDPLASLWNGNRVDSSHSGGADALKLLAGAATQVGVVTDRVGVEPYTPNIAYDSLDELTGALPYQPELEAMVKHFVERELVAFPIMHGPSLIARVEHFDRMAIDIDPCSIALLLAIALFETWYSTTNPKSTVKKDATIASYLKACRAALEMDSYLERPSLDALRSLLILHRFHLFSDRASSRALLAQAFQLAQSLGLDTDQPPELLAASQPFEIQERRRLFAFMIYEDYCRWSDRHYTISPIHYNAELPSNTEDGQTGVANPSNVPGTHETVVQHLLFRASIGAVARLITDRAYSLQSKPTWSQLCDVERDLRRIENSLNASLQVSWAGSGIAVLPEGASELVFDRYIVMVELKQQYIRLFRPFLTRGLRHETMSAGRLAVIEAARYILGVHRAVSQDARAARCWTLTHHVLNALLILAIDVFQDKNSATVTACQTDIVSSIAILESKPATSELTREILAIVKKLTAGPATSKASRKRDRDAYEGSSGINGDASDLAFLLSGDSNTGNASSTFPFAGGMSSAETFDPSLHASANAPSASSTPMRPFDPNQPFTKALPVPMTNDPFVSRATLAAIDIESDTPFDGMWEHILRLKAMYAIPDIHEWRELVKSTSAGEAWRNSIDILS